jgi:DUF1365 family protein
MTVRSALYRGRVGHARLRPKRHQFEYRVFYGLFDVDELPTLDRRLRLFSSERFNLFSLHSSDHGPDDGGSLRDWAETRLHEAGIDLRGGRIELLAFPRVLGYVFNPISVWYCYGPAGDLAAVMHEVRNTFGDKHTYVVPIGNAGLRHEFTKEMHVSPFTDMDSTYEFAVTLPEDRVSLGITQRDDDGPLLRASLRATRLEMTDRNLFTLFVTHPLVTFKVIAAIHREALRLWRKGLRYRPRPDPSPRNVSVVGSPVIKEPS